MVDKEIITNIFNDTLSFFEVKCKPLKEVHSDLSKMSQEEKNQKLESLLNPGEKEWYEGIIHRIGNCERAIQRYEERLKGDFNYESDREYYEDSLKHEKDRIKFLNELAFPYERRIIEGYDKETNTPKTVDINEYDVESQIKFMGNNIIGKIEEKLINKQSQISFSDDAKNSLREYFGSGAGDLNSMLNNGNRWNRLNKTEQEVMKSRCNSIDKGLQEVFNNVDSIGQSLTVFHGGEFDVSRMVGDTVKFKGYTSTSFQQNVAKEFSNYSSVPSELYYTYRILLPPTTKGVCANDMSKGELTTHSHEQELLLNKGLEGNIVDIDYDNHIVTIVP